MKTITILLTTILFSFNFYSQITWSYKGDYREIHGVYDSNHFAVQNSARQNQFTQDGGATWQNSGASSSSLQPIVNMYYLSTNTVFAMVRNGSNFDFKKSRDGGSSYSFQGQLLPAGFTPSGVFELYFFDSLNGLAISRSVVSSRVLDVMHRTNDGGITWSFATSDSSQFDNYEDVTFYKSGTVRVYGSGSIYESKDKGVTWNNIGSTPLGADGNFGGNGLDKVFGVGWAGSTKPCVVKSIDSGRTFSAWNGVPDTANGGIILCKNFLHPINLRYNNNGEMIVHGLRWLGSRTNVSIYSNDDGVTWQEATYGTGYESEFIRLADDGKTFVNHTFNAKLWVLCKSSSTTTGLQDLQKKQVLVYPNPAIDRLTVVNPDSRFNIIEIVDLSGKILISKQLTLEKGTLDLTGLNKGIYIVKLSRSGSEFNSVHISKLIKH